MYRKMNTIFLRDTAGNPEWARQRHPARSGSQSQLAYKASHKITLFTHLHTLLPKSLLKI